LNDRERREELFGRIRIGDVVTGTVAGLAGYGAFVHIGEPTRHLFGDGLIPIAELSWHSVERVTDVVVLGQRVEVRVIGLDPDQGRISLSLRQAQD
jgi:small subunit ribosomal protein S1